MPWVNTSDAPELSSAQLGFSSSWKLFSSARLVRFLGQLVLRKFGQIELFVDFEFYGGFFFKCDIHINVIQILVPSR